MLRVLRSGVLSKGAEVAAFESEFGGIVGGRSCIAVCSGTAALHLLLLAHGIGPGDEVVVPSFTFAATANAVRLTGATPVFADIDPASFCLDSESVTSVLSERTVAILAVHLFGHPVDAPALRGIAQRKGLLFLEDAAQAHGAQIGGSPVGALGDGAAFSFYPTKNMTTGEGGMVVVSDPAVAERVRLLRNQGMAASGDHRVVGFNLRMTEIEAAIGRVQLLSLAARTATRIAHATEFDVGLRGVSTPFRSAGILHVYHQYTIRTPRRDALSAYLRAAGIETRAYYAVPVHRLAPYAAECALPHTECAADEVLSLPVGPHLSASEIAHVITTVGDWGDC